MQNTMPTENKYVKGLIYVLVGLVILVALLALGNVIASSRSGEAFGVAFTPGGNGAQLWNSEAPLTGWLPWIVIGGILLYLIYVFFAESEMFQIGTREVVMMALGAALYGVLAWIFNIVPVPSVSLVALRPVVVIPIFFGFVFGPAVGFFTGAFGNILGDALTGWGVFPIWDLANGLMGLIPGLAGMYLMGKERRINAQILLWVSVAVLALAVVLPLISPNITDPFSGEAANFGAWWGIMLVVLIVVLATALAPQYWPYLLILLTLVFAGWGVYNMATAGFSVGVLIVVLATALAPQYWPYLLILLTLVFAGWGVYNMATAGFSVGVLILWVIAILCAAGAWYVNSKTEAITAWLDDEDTRTLAVWGTIAVIIGIGFAAMADIFYNGYSFTTAFIGEFIPAAGPNILFAVILTPLVYAAWKQARAQTGR